jgi:hypothetical protein
LPASSEGAAKSSATVDMGILQASVLVALLVWYVARAVAGFADEFSAAEALVAFDVDYAAPVAYVTFENALFRGQFPSSFAFIAFGWN